MQRDNGHSQIDVAQVEGGSKIGAESEVEIRPEQENTQKPNANERSTEC